MYDQVGIDILKNGAEGPSIDPSQIFEQFFGGFGGGGFGGGGFGGFPFGNMGGRENRKEKEDCVIEHYVKLEDIYNEKITEVNYKQKLFCKDCDLYSKLQRRLSKTILLRWSYEKYPLSSFFGL